MAAPAKRIDGIDFWRGFGLLTIFIDHVPENVFQHVTQQNFGFSDAAELFVFLSGVSVAVAYGTRFFDGETIGAIRAVLRRAFTIYWVQILISLLIVAIFAGAAALWKEDDLLEDADVVVSNPLQTTAAILALLHQLENANILPLYIALLLMTPLLLVLARRDDRLMLAASAGIYLAARAFSLNLPTWPVEGTWWFNPIAWQLIFAIGIVAGRRLKRRGIAYRCLRLCVGAVAARAGRARLQDRSRIRAARAFPRACLRRLSFRSHRPDAADPGIPTAVPDRPLQLAGFCDWDRAERHDRARRDARRSFQPRASVRGRYRRRRHPYPLSRRPRPCRVGDKSRAQQSMMNRAHTLQMAAPVPLRKSPIVLWSGTSWPVSHIRPSPKSYPRVAAVPSGQDWRDNDRHESARCLVLAGRLCPKALDCATPRCFEIADGVIE